MVWFMPFGVRVFAKPMRYCSLVPLTLYCLSLSCSNGVIVRSLMVCSGLQKCSATPALSTFSLIMSCLCSLNLSFSHSLVSLIYWQFLCPLFKSVCVVMHK